MKNDEKWSQNGSQNDEAFEVRGGFWTSFFDEKRHPRKVSEMRPQRWPKGIPNGANWIQNGTQMAPRNIPMVIGLITGRKWTPKCPALPQTSPCASIRPPFFPSTSCPHRFPLGAAVSRSAYNAFGVILGPIFYMLLILFLNPQNRGFAIPSHTFHYLCITKALILGPLFYNFFDPILGPPFEEPFGPPCPPKVPTLPPHVDFEPFLGPPLDPKWDLGATRFAPKGKKN